MKRTTISLNDKVSTLADDYIKKQEVSPSLSAVINQALLEFFENKNIMAEFKKRGLRELKDFPDEIFTFDGPPDIERDISINHDKYLVEITADDY